MSSKNKTLAIHEDWVVVILGFLIIVLALFAFLIAQLFNVFVTLAVAFLLFGNVKK